MSRSQADAPWHRPNDVELAHIKRALPMLRQSMKPASPRSVALWVEFLLSRYPRREEQHAAFSDMDKQTWLAVLREWPEDVLQAAVMAWLSEDRPFPPKVPGELKKLGEPILVARRLLINAGERVLALPPPEGSEAAPEPAEPGALRKLADMLGSSLKSGLLPPMRGKAR